MRLRHFGECLLATFVLATPSLAQKKALTQADWDRWRSIQGATLSNDGKWVAYTLSPQVGDGEFVVRSTTGNTEYRVPVGYIGRPNNIPGGDRARGGGAGGGRAGGGGRGGGGGAANGPFTADSRYAFVSVQASKEEVERQERAAAARGRAGRAGGGGGPTNQNSIVMISLADGKITPMPTMRSYRLPEASGKWMVYTAASDSANSDSSRAGAPLGGRSGSAPRGPRRTYGTPITLRNLDSSADEVIADVVAYQFDDSAKVLAYTVAARADSTRDGVYIRNLVTGTTRPVVTGPGNYRALAFDRTQQQFVFTTDREEFGRPNAKQVIYLGNVRSGSAEPVVRSEMLPEGMRFPDAFNVSLTRNGTAMQFAIAPPPEDTVPADSLVGKARFDLWHYKDPVLQPTQLLQVNQARNRTYNAVYHLATKKLLQLTHDSFPSVQLSDDGRIGVQSTGVPYDIQRM